MRYFRLNTTHPTAKKVEKVIALLEKQGLKLEIGQYGQIFVEDKAFPKERFKIADIEGIDSPSELPPFTEYKVMVEKPDSFQPAPTNNTEVTP